MWLCSPWTGRLPAPMRPSCACCTTSLTATMMRLHMRMPAVPCSVRLPCVAPQLLICAPYTEGHQHVLTVSRKLDAQCGAGSSRPAAACYTRASLLCRQAMLGPGCICLPL